MKRVITPAPQAATALVTDAWDAVGASFERFCLTAGVVTLTRMMKEDATALCGQRHERLSGSAAYRWGKTLGKIGFHGGKIEIARPRLRGAAARRRCSGGRRRWPVEVGSVAPLRGVVI